jgi:hypothetical protein
LKKSINNKNVKKRTKVKGKKRCKALPSFHPYQYISDHRIDRNGPGIPKPAFKPDSRIGEMLQKEMMEDRMKMITDFLIATKSFKMSG